MAMRTYGIETKGMIINIDEFKKLMDDNQDKIIEKGFFKENEEVKNINTNKCLLSNVVDFDEILDFIENIVNAFFVSEFNGYLDFEGRIGRCYVERTYFGGRYDTEEVVIFELFKDNLWECYKNEEEIYNELKRHLLDVGIEVDNKYIIEHIGYINGSYVA